VNGNDIADQGHFPFGEAWYLGSAGTKWQFTTHERDAESGRPPSGCLNLWPLHGHLNRPVFLEAILCCSWTPPAPARPRR